MHDQFPIVSLQGGDGNDILINFKKEEFREFILSLVSTPREERRERSVGFDFLKDDLRRIWEKLRAQIGTHSDLLDSSAVISVFFLKTVKYHIIAQINSFPSIGLRKVLLNR